MASYNRELINLEMELDNSLETISNPNQSQFCTQSGIATNFKPIHSQPQNDIFGTEYLQLNGQSDLNYGLGIQTAGNIIPSPSDDYSDMELHKYLNFDSSIEPSPSRADVEARRNQSLDDFFQDFNEIISTEMKTSSHGLSSTTADMVTYSDHSKPFNSNVAGVDFNLDMSQFYVNTSESDFLSSMLQPTDLKTDYTNVMIQHPQPQFNTTYQDKVTDDHLKFSVLDLTSENRNTAEVQYIDNYHDTVFNDHLEFSIIGHPNESERGEFFHENLKVSDNTQCNQYYVDFKLNGEATSTSNEDNSIVTYISKDALQSVEYINESGQTETVMYVDHQSDMNHGETNGTGVTQYEIIDFDSYQYPQNHNDSLLVGTFEPNNSQPQFYGETLEIGHQTDILSTLLSDKNNKIIIIAKPLKHPKVKQTIDDIFLKFEEIDNNPTNISFEKRPKVKGCRKQKLETINQIELVDKKRGRPQINRPKTSTKTFIPETPIRSSKFVRDRKNKEVRRKRLRKLNWDSESDWEGTEN